MNVVMDDAGNRVEIDGVDMSTNDLFWVLAGLVCGIAVSFVIIAPLWRSLASRDAASKRSRIAAGAVAAVFAATAFGLYAYLGETQHIADAGRSSAAPEAHARASERGSRTDSMAVATEKLQQKLARGDGTEADWALLAQAYDYIGDTAAAERARSHQPTKVPSTRTQATTAVATQILSAANQRRMSRDFTGAQHLYEQAIAQQGMTADAWADYADTLASQSQARLSGAPATAIEAALRIDPSHLKALWLKATLALQEQRYADALGDWQQLRAVIPTDSPDLRVIDANISETRSLLGNAPQLAQVAACSAASTKQVCGTVDVAAALKKGVSEDMTLFVYAKARKSPGPPVAVYRSPVTTWPMQFELTDASAMMPTRRLSDFDDVIIEARLSRSGQAIAARGDLQAVGASVRPGNANSVALLISQVVQ